ncbi:vacuolar membrane protein-domain-containing protein [Lentinula guzmanii]|uniref:Vacuolar membrane protein-domain-containing protein n=1 Tax=Lentinula guzmanii TaxID=2804957 RepID=A0AA38JTM1_9AGAR|nr:vacuolar membrane protein-domain-containing protein [Lentinula guzmanii]
MAEPELEYPPPSSSWPSFNEDGSYPDVDRHSCQLFGPTALIVQGLMGILVILSLIFKRQREKPMRPWKIWLFDISKQVVGQMFVHGVNVLISNLLSQFSSENACVSYFLNILVDTTLGVALIYLILHVLTLVFSERLHLKGFESGIYGNPPRVKYWARQAALYVVALTTMKFLVIGLLALFPGLFKIGAWLLSWTWTDEGDAFQVIFVMGIFPIIMNILQFWLIDSIVKASSSPVALGADGDAANPENLDREPLFGVSSDDDDDNDNLRPQRDVGHHRPRSRSRNSTSSNSHSPDKSITFSDNPYESKSSGSGSRTEIVDSHSYPPSLSSSLTSTSSTSSIREANKLNKKRRPPPAPLNLSPAPIPMPTQSKPVTRPKTDEPDVVRNEWADTWHEA